MAGAARRRPPSYYRYLQRNPTIALHIPQEFRARIDRAKGQASYGQLFQFLFEQFEAAVEQRVGQIRGSIEVSYPCAICRKPCPLRPGNPDTQQAVELLMQHRWGHRSCHERQSSNR